MTGINLINALLFKFVVVVLVWTLIKFGISLLRVVSLKKGAVGIQINPLFALFLVEDKLFGGYDLFSQIQSFHFAN